MWWEKGLTLDEVAELNRELPHPYIIHFRKTSAGSNTDNLCHPFPISERARDDLSGQADRVLFHNGTVNDWKDYYRSFVASRSVKQTIEHGFERLSDTRAMAYMAHHQTQLAEGDTPILQGENLLQILDNRSRWAILDATAVGEDRDCIRRLGRWKYAVEIDSKEDAIAYPVENKQGRIFEGGLIFSNSAWKRQKTTTQ